MRAFAKTKSETLVHEEVSMTNLTVMARNLAKIAFAFPGVVFSVALGQIEAYTNLTEVVVECGIFHDLGYDVLVWSLLSSLGGKDRNRNDTEFALLPSRWLLALSSSLATPPGNSTDLVTQGAHSQMSGIVPDTDFTDAQLAAMTGGELLRRQTLINLQETIRINKDSEKTNERVTDTKLGGQLLLSIAQHRQSAIYNVSDDEAPIKLLATMIDDTQMILFQFLDLLRSNLSIEEFDDLVPGIPELMKDFGLDPTLAFMIGRPSIAHQDVTAKDDVQMSDVKEVASPSEVAILEADPLHELLLPYINTVEMFLPEGSWAFLTSDHSYEAEISRLLKEQGDVMKDRTDMTRAEFGKQVGAFSGKKHRLLKRKNLWFSNVKGDLGVREDLSLAGNAILVQLKKKSKSWVMVQAFGYSLPLNFKPQSRANSMGVSTPKLPATNEVEDGEVDDAKLASAADPSQRWNVESGRDGTNRAPSNGYRTPDNGGRLSREAPVPPPKASVVSDRGPAINPERLALVNPERPELINPERAALISSGNEPSRSDSPRRLRDDARERSSRQNSPPPRRHDSEKDHQHPRRDDRPNRNAPIDPHNTPRGRAEDAAPPPAGPRGDDQQIECLTDRLHQKD
ncbi:hypothetical protein DID88_002634 [Monilinia fructigena]|uniref:THO complex subunitTHOC2 N-terminal domain-containing protein n=1 Tax=Monilinia fructigena TaxID=38457 RepID=A0A395IPD0_9HELO|nr:hypothetical protein DID88_002634 [Monilinia fructigena]